MRSQAEQITGMIIKKTLKALFYTIGILLILFLLCIVFISPIAKYLIEKYDEKYTGRQIKLDWVYINPFTGYLYCSKLRIYEAKSDSLFLTADDISVNFGVRKLFSETYEINDIVIDNPKIIVIQNGNKHNFNFDDLLEKFSPRGVDTIVEPVHFSIFHFKIKDGELHYRENVIPVNYFIKKVNLESDGIGWDSDMINAKFFFLPGVGKGDLSGNATINMKNRNYRIVATVHKFDLSFIEQYLKDISNYGRFTANMDADINATGNFNRARDIEAKGKMAINDFHFGKNPGEDYLSFKKFEMNIINLGPEKHKYLFDTVLLDHPFFKYEIYDHLDNIQTMFGKGGSNIKAVHNDAEHFNLILEIADYVEKLAKNFLRSYYRINRLEVRNGDFVYNDFSLSEKFSVAANPVNMEADSIDKRKEWVRLSFKSGIKPYGNATLHLTINPKDSSDFDLRFYLEKLPLSIFNPYLITYTSFPIDRGTMEFKALWKVRSGNITSDNHLIIIDPRSAKRLKKKDAGWIPVPLIMAFVRERGNVIDYEIPITGNLHNPKFHLKDVIFDLLENIVVKPPTTPYRAVVRTVEREIENSLTLKWEMRQSVLTERQGKFINKIVNFLKKNPEASISINPMEYTQKEKEYILLYEAKKKYFLLSENKKTEIYTKDDSLQVVKMSVKDSSFVKYLNKHLTPDLVFTIQEKCSRFIGNDLINKEFEKMLNQRRKNFIDYFNENDISKQVKIHRSRNVIPFNGFSYFKINYKGSLPISLIKAYKELDELNEKPPRDKYFDLRKKIGKTF